jgi:hypothetical protein
VTLSPVIRSLCLVLHLGIILMSIRNIPFRSVGFDLSETLGSYLRSVSIRISISKPCKKGRHFRTVNVQPIVEIFQNHSQIVVDC